MAIRLVNKPDGNCSREEPVRHTGESRKEPYIRGHLSPVYISAEHGVEGVNESGCEASE